MGNLICKRFRCRSKSNLDQIPQNQSGYFENSSIRLLNDVFVEIACVASKLRVRLQITRFDESHMLF